MSFECPTCGKQTDVLVASGDKEKVCGECSKKRGDSSLKEINQKAKEKEVLR